MFLSVIIVFVNKVHEDKFSGFKGGETAWWVHPASNDRVVVLEILSLPFPSLL